MARIVYGLCGIGIGHAVRSRVILDYLSKKHDLLILSSNKIAPYLRKYYPNVHAIEGFEFVFENNALSNSRTLAKNLLKINPNTIDNLELIKRKIDQFDPQLIISDMETFSMYLARWKNIPLLTIDNQHFLIYGKYASSKRYFLEYFKARLVLGLATRKADHHLILLFPGEKLDLNKKTTGITPILREEIFKIKPKKQDYVFVYQSTKTYKKLLALLEQVNEKFIIYGFDLEKKYKNLTFKKFDDRKRFLKDLSCAKAVISNGGFTLISEALYLQKPLLVIPIKKHFEQIFNAAYIKKNNYGEFYPDLSRKNILEFLARVDKKDYSFSPKWNNKESYKKLDFLIDKLARK